MERLHPNITAAFFPQNTRFSALAGSGVADVKAYAITSVSPNKLIVLYAEGDPEAIQAIKATLNAGIDKGISLNKTDVAIDHGMRKWKTEHRMFSDLRRAALIAYHPSVLSYKSEYGADCYMLQDHPEAFTPWFVASFGDRLKKIIDVPIQTHWYQPLLDVGIDEKMVERQQCLGCDAYVVSTNAMVWGDLISQLLKDKKIEMRKE